MTFGSILFCSNNESAKNYLADTNRSAVLFGLANVGLIGSTCAIVCCSHLTRKHPHNMILLSIYTFSQSVLLSTIAVSFDTETISMAVGTTFAVTGLLAYFAQNTSIDFTGLGIYLYVTLWVLMLFGIMAIFVNIPYMHLMYSLLGTILFSLYIVYDVQLILGGGHKVQFGIDDYVMAALMLYIDIIQLFIFILRLISESNNR